MIKTRPSPLLAAVALTYVSLATTAFGSPEPRLLSAFFGLDNSLPRGANILCQGAAGTRSPVRDGEAENAQHGGR